MSYVPLGRRGRGVDAWLPCFEIGVSLVRTECSEAPCKDSPEKPSPPCIGRCPVSSREGKQRRPPHEHASETSAHITRAYEQWRQLLTVQSISLGLIVSDCVCECPQDDVVRAMSRSLRLAGSSLL